MVHNEKWERAWCAKSCEGWHKYSESREVCGYGTYARCILVCSQGDTEELSYTMKGNYAC